MSDRSWIIWTDISGTIGFSLSILSNSCLFLMICFLKTTKNIGSYKYLLIIFCIFTLFYASVEMLLRPLIHSYDDTLFLIQRKRFDWGKLATRLVATTYCGCYAMSFTLFALQFIHRYIATCKPQHLHHFDGKNFLLWIFGAISIAISWACAALFLFPQTLRTHQSFLTIIKDSYDLDPYWTDYVPYKYFYYNELGQKLPDLQNMSGIFQHLLVIFISFLILFYCGTQTFFEMHKFRGISNKTRDLQFQLFRALVVQTIFPMIFVYIPTAFILACPFFGLEFGAITNYQSILTQLYPGIDPIIFIFLIRDYRKTVKRVIFGKVFKNTVASEYSAPSS
ncbi:unnamed protein product [Caenorhabditis angaria]|uniref:Serpentine receptor class r-10 n=1 Tax=Caenorhabditis angaria TaxID=860376 RepID=A0A9P1ITE0_9PELO|nr:unnamed protein product [Caenorhabditis angaria]